jgi:hypothetical protein
LVLQPLPTLVVAVDLTNKIGWFAWHLDLFESPKELLAQRTRTLTVRIPQTNRLDESGWASIRRDLSAHFKALHQALSNDEILMPLLKAVNNLARIAGNLMRIGASSVPTPPLTKSEGITILIEQIELRDLIDTVRDLLARIDSRSEPHKQITFWLSSFETTATAAYPRLNSLPPKGHDIPAGLELALSPNKLLDARPKLVLAAVDLLSGLAPRRDRIFDQRQAALPA